MSLINLVGIDGPTKAFKLWVSSEIATLRCIRAIFVYFITNMATQTKNMANFTKRYSFLNLRGIAFVNINYRLVFQKKYI